MSFLVTCTFDLKNASRADYDTVYSDLEKIGLKKVVISSQGTKIVAPTPMTIGEFDGASVGDVRDNIRDRVQAAFQETRIQLRDIRRRGRQLGLGSGDHLTYPAAPGT
jgi:hypothetical protein